MKFKAKQRSATIPGDIDQIISVSWHPDTVQNAFAVWLISPQEMEKRIAEEKAGVKKASPMTGVIQYLCLVGDQAIVYPLPDCDGELKLIYFPHRKEG